MRKAGIQAVAVLTMNIEPAVAQTKGLSSGRRISPMASRIQDEPINVVLAALSLSLARTNQASNSPGRLAARKAHRHPHRCAMRPPTRNARKVPTGLPAIVMAIAEVPRCGKYSRAMAVEIGTAALSPRPAPARPTRRIGKFVVAAQRSEKTLRSATSPARIRDRSLRSDHAPIGILNAAFRR